MLDDPGLSCGSSVITRVLLSRRGGRNRERESGKCNVKVCLVELVWRHRWVAATQQKDKQTGSFLDLPERNVVSPADPCIFSQVSDISPQVFSRIFQQVYQARIMILILQMKSSRLRDYKLLV